jgi:single-stranded DNA-binding protein
MAEPKDWHRVVMFGKVAEFARPIAKASLVMVEG